MAIFGPPNTAKLKARKDLPALTKALAWKKDPRVRQSAAAAIAEIGGPAAVQPLLDATEDPDSEVRVVAARGLGVAGESSALGPLMRLLVHEEPAMREAAALSLGDLRDPRAVDPLMGALQDGYSAVRVAGTQALASIGEPAVPSLVVGLRQADAALRKGSAEALLRIGRPAIEALVAALADPEIRDPAVQLLGQIADPTAIGPLLAMLGSGNEGVRKAAAEALDLLGWVPDRTEVGAAYWAARGLWQQCAEIGPPAVGALISGLRHHDSMVRQIAARALGQIGDTRAVEPLITALRGREEVRAAAAEALGLIGDEFALEPLLNTLRDRSGIVRAAAATALGHIDDAHAVDRLIGALRDQEPAVRQAAARALGEIGDPRAVEALIAAMVTREDVKAAAAQALGAIGDVRAVEPLVDALQDWRICVVAAEALAQIGAPAAVPLVATLGNPDDVVRNAAVEGLIVQIGAPAVKPLVAALADRHETVRHAAAAALESLGWTPERDEAGAAYWAAKYDWNSCLQVGSRAVEPLVTAASTWQRADLRVSAAQVLGLIGNARAVEPLCKILRDEDREVRRAGADALGRIGDNRAVPALVATLKDRDRVVRRAVADALAVFDDDPAALRALRSVHHKDARGHGGAAESAEAIAGLASDASAGDRAALSATGLWMPTHLVPQYGMAAWEAPDPTRPPTWTLPPNLDLTVELVAGDWAGVRASNGWWGWVDGRLLVARGVAS